jgi:phosphatidylserine decarboxylase
MGRLCWRIPLRYLESADQVPALARIFLQEDLNFLVTNRIPRRLATQLVGWLSTIDNPAFTRIAVSVWQWFAGDLGLTEAKAAEFRTIRDCFTRELKAGARPIDADPAVLVSPCDGIVGAMGWVRDAAMLQAKGLHYAIDDLLVDPAVVERHRNCQYVTLRLKSSMYHRFHAPCDARVTSVTYVSGDTWNVNPIALERVERLFCKNERAVIDLDTGVDGEALTLVAVASILVASLKIHAVDHILDLRHRGRKTMSVDAPVAKGNELGYFQTGSTIIVLASGGLTLDPSIRPGHTVRVGAPLFRRTPNHKSRRHDG